jgi:hypothetical protein
MDRLVVLPLSIKRNSPRRTADILLSNLRELREIFQKLHPQTLVIKLDRSRGMLGQDGPVVVVVVVAVVC